LAEEEVYGGVQLGVDFDYEDYPNIPYHSDTVDGQENQEE
jgi:hypothetical protein